MVDRRVIAILGMHRSGTSWLTGSLEHAGLALGEVNTSAQHNRKGNRENESLQRLHEAVLVDNGGSWRRPASANRWSEGRSLELAGHIAAMDGEHSLWGFKDPRALLLLDEWHRQVGGLVRIGIYRHPVSVYRSLRKRHPDFGKKEAIRLWLMYNERLLKEHEHDPFPVMRFDVATPARHEQLRETCRQLDLSDPATAETFFDEGLVHNEAGDERIPRAAADMWERLDAVAMQPKRTGA